MQVRALGGAGLIASALMFGTMSGTAFAQDNGLKAYAEASPADQPTDVEEDSIKPVGAPLSQQEDDALSRALVFDSASMTQNAPAKTLKVQRFAVPGTDISSKDKDDGTGSVSVKQPFTADFNSLPTDLDAKVGADLSLAAPPPVTYDPNGPMPGGSTAASTGSAFASLGVDDLASLDARVTPGTNEGKVGTTLQRSLPFGDRFAVTVHDTYAVSEALSPTTSAPAGLPVMALPAQSIASPEPVWSNDRGVKFSILPTGTSLSAGVANLSNDPITHNSLSADQKLYGPLHVTTSFNDVGETTMNKSITAGLKLNW
jgi:hypothetical protein